MRVFISYAKEDEDCATRLYVDLKRQGLNPWLDKEMLRGGQDWRLEIHNAIKNARYFIALLSKNSVSKKGFVQRELRAALDELAQYPPSEIFLIPVRKERCIVCEESLERLQYIDLFPDYQEGFEKLLKSFPPTAAEIGNTGRVLAPTFDSDLFIDRDPNRDFARFLKQWDRMVFPILGGGGTGKTWQLQYYLNCLDPTFRSVVISARLISDPHYGIMYRLLSAFPGVDRKNNSLEFVFQSIRDIYPVNDNGILLVIDGLNECYFDDLAFRVAKRLLSELFDLAKTYKVHVIFSCRIFTWQEFLRQETFETHFFVSEIIHTIKLINEYNPDTDEMIEKTVKIPKNRYGLSLGDFDSDEKRLFWERLGRFIEISNDVRQGYDGAENPFLLGLLANYLIHNEGFAPPFRHLLSEFIKRQIGKGTGNERWAARNLLIQFAEKMVSPVDNAVCPYLDSDQLKDLRKNNDFIYLVGSGLIDMSETDSGNERYFFAHDIILHHFLAEVLRERYGLRALPAQLALIEMFRLANDSIKNSNNEYSREALRSILNDFVGDPNYCRSYDYLPAKVFRLLCEELREPLDKEAFRKLTHYIFPLRTWGYWAAISCRRSAAAVDVELLLVDAAKEDPDSHLVANAIVLSPMAREKAAIDFLGHVSERAKTEIIRLRCAFALGEFDSTNSFRILRGLLDLRSRWFTPVNNACLYSLGKLGYTLNIQDMGKLEQQEGSQWRLDKYRKEIKKTLA